MESETIRRETEQQSIELVLFLEFIENLVSTYTRCRIARPNNII